MSGDKLGGWVVSAWLTTTNGKGGEGVVENFRPGMPGIPLLLEQLRNSNDAEMCERNPPATTTTTLDWPPPTKTLEHLSPLFLCRRNDDSQKKNENTILEKNCFTIYFHSVLLGRLLNLSADPLSLQNWLLYLLMIYFLPVSLAPFHQTRNHGWSEQGKKTEKKSEIGPNS